MRPRGLLRYEQEICNVISNSIRRFAPNGEQTGRLTETGLEKLSELGNMIVNNDNVDFQRYFHPIIGWFDLLTPDLTDLIDQTDHGWVKLTTCLSKTVQIGQFLELLTISIWNDFLLSDQCSQFSQWKCIQLSTVITIDSFLNFIQISSGHWGEGTFETF